MKLHQRQFILVVSSRYQTGFRGMDNFKDKQKMLVVLTSSIWYSFYFHQAAPGKGVSDGPTPLIGYMPLIGKCL